MATISKVKVGSTTYDLTLNGLTSSVTELNYCDGVTSNIQTQINNLQSTVASLGEAILQLQEILPTNIQDQVDSLTSAVNDLYLEFDTKQDKIESWGDLKG